MKTSLTLTVLASLVAFAAAANAQTGGMRAGHLGLFAPTGGQGNARLLGGAPPVIGGFTSARIDAPGNQFAAVFLTGLANPAGTPVRVGQDDLRVYTDPLSFIHVEIVPLSLTGQGMVQLPIPPAPGLAGLDLAWQAVVFPPSLMSVATSNLLLSNLGFDPTAGNMVFANFVEHNVPITGGDSYDLPFVTDSDVKVTICGTRNPPDHAIVIEVYDDTNTLVSTQTLAGDTKGNKSWCATASVPKGGKVKIRNPSPNRQDKVTVSISSIDAK